MIQEEILQYNKRCAEFLRWNKTHPKIKEWHIYITPIGHVSYDKMLFHSDWNWIMEVVEAIEKIDNIDFYMEWFWLNGNNIALYQRGKHNGITLWEYIARFSNAKTKKEVVVEAINQFLIWYEQNKNKTL